MNRGRPMREHLPLVAAFACGLLLGAVFFGGLWLTVRCAISSSRIALLVLWPVSSRGRALRSADSTSWREMAGRDCCRVLLGFIAARLIVTWLHTTDCDDSRKGNRDGSCALAPIN